VVDGGAEGTDCASQTGACEACDCSRWERGLTSTDPPSMSWSPAGCEEGVPVEEAAAKYTTKEDLRRRCAAFLLESPLMFAGTADAVPPEKSAGASPTSSRASASSPTSKASVTIVMCTRVHSERLGPLRLYAVPFKGVCSELRQDDVGVADQNPVKKVLESQLTLDLSTYGVVTSTNLVCKVHRVTRRAYYCKVNGRKKSTS